jgi:hypothetical protein
MDDFVYEYVYTDGDGAGSDVLWTADGLVLTNFLLAC